MPAAPRRLLLPFAIMILCLVGLGVASFMLLSGEQGAQSSTIGGPFRLMSTNGHEVTDADFKGHPFLVFFGYTHCPDICPTVLFQLSQVLKAMGDKQIKALFITVDPERDTPAVMKEYLSSFDPHIIGLSGTRQQIDAAEKAYRVYARKEPGHGSGDYAMDHTAVVYLMDKEGRFATAFNLDRPPQVAAQDLDTYF
jgi:protein SCO1